MADCGFHFEKTELLPDRVEFRVYGARHPCTVRFRVDGTPVPVDPGESIAPLSIINLGGDRCIVKGPEGQRFEVEAEVECPPLEEVSDLRYRPCGPTRWSLTHQFREETGFWGEVWRTLILPVSGTAYLLERIGLSLQELLERLGVSWADPEAARARLRRLRPYLPKWLRRLL